MKATKNFRLLVWQRAEAVGSRKRQQCAYLIIFVLFIFLLLGVFGGVGGVGGVGGIPGCSAAILNANFFYKICGFNKRKPRQK